MVCLDLFANLVIDLPSGQGNEKTFLVPCICAVLAGNVHSAAGRLDLAWGCLHGRAKDSEVRGHLLQ